jgi:hypothetical protein
VIRWILEQAQAVAAGWNKFWFDSRSDSALITLSAFRLCFGAVMLFFFFTRAIDLEFFYGDNGIMPAWHMRGLEFFRYHPTFLVEGIPLWVLYSLHSLLLIAVFFVCIGLFTRWSAIVAYVLNLAFLNRNVSVMFGVDMISTFFLLYLCFADANARYSVDSRIGRGANRQSVLSHISMRLMQIQLCIIYGYSGLEKMKGTRWWDGSALWDVLTMGNMQRWDLSFVAHAPVLLALGVYVVLAWEAYFPALIWVPRLRLPMLFFGVIMHLGIYLFMNLPTFGFMMMSYYILFLKPEEVERGMAALRRYTRGWPGLGFTPKRS